MTIRELIERLACYPEDCRVVFYERGDDGDEFPIGEYVDITHIEYLEQEREVRLS